MYTRFSAPCGNDQACGEAARRGRHVRDSRPSREAAAFVRVDTRSDLVVQTAEGDRVTISLTARAQVESASRTGRGGSVQLSSASASSQVRVNVQGNLSADELSDIGKLISALGEGAVDLEQLESLAGFRYRQTQSIQTGSIFRLAA